MTYKFDIRPNWVQVADDETASISGMLANSSVDLSAPGKACSFFIVSPQVGNKGSVPIRAYGFVDTNSETIIGFLQEGLRGRLALQFPGTTPEVPASGDYSCSTAQYAQLWARWKYGNSAAIKVIESADAYVVGPDDVVYLLQDSLTFETLISKSVPGGDSIADGGLFVPIVTGKALGGLFVPPPVPCGTTVVSGSDQGNGALPGIVDVNALSQDKGMSGWTIAAIGAGVLAAGGVAWAVIGKKKR